MLRCRTGKSNNRRSFRCYWHRDGDAHGNKPRKVPDRALAIQEPPLPFLLFCMMDPAILKKNISSLSDSSLHTVSPRRTVANAQLMCI